MQAALYPCAPQVGCNQYSASRSKICTIRLPLVVDAPQAVITPRTERAAGL
jgi:hypothetical protein